MLKSQISPEWLNAIHDYFESSGPPSGWYVYRQGSEDSGEWGISAPSLDDDKKLFICDSFDEARVILAAFVFAYEIVKGEVIAVEVGEGYTVMGGGDA
jgi:hypothetical protein